MHNQLPILILLFSLLIGRFQAQEPIRIEVDVGDNPFTVTGRLGETNSFIGNLRLTALEGDIETFAFLPSDLKHAGTDEKVGRQNISLIGDRTLQAGVPKDFQVSITGIDEPGIYEGRIEILAPRQPRDDALIIDFVVQAKARPNLSLLPGTNLVHLNLVNCRSRPDCALAHWLLPASAFLNSRLLQLDNLALADVVVSDLEVVVLGEQTGYQLSQAELGLLQEQQALPPAQISALPLAINRTGIPPDHYTGAIYLTLDNGPDRLTIPIDFNVRIGPFWPLVALLIGVVLGRLVKYMQERGQPQAESLAAVYRTAFQISQAHADDRILLEPMVEEVRQLVYRERLETVKDELAVIGSRQLALQNLRLMKEDLEKKKTNEMAKEGLEKIDQARQCIGRKEDVGAKNLTQEVKAIQESLKSNLMGDGQPDSETQTAINAADAAIQALDQAAHGKSSLVQETKGWQQVRRKLRDWLIFLTGLSDEIRAEANLRLVRPLLYIALLAVLLALGINSLYVDSGLTFGTNPLADYLGLILWGLSADIASRSLSNLPSIQ